jgi:hypothetical protein
MRYKRKYLETAKERIARMPVCTIDGCTANQRCKGLCPRHYDALIRRGTPHGVKAQRARGTGSIKESGYKLVHVNGKQRPEHVLVVEKALGKPLPKGAIVHHLDEDKLNNDPSNLVVCPDDAYHFLLHQRQRALDACGHADWRKCPFCKEYDAPENLHITEHNLYHRACRSAYRKAAYAAAKTSTTKAK